MAQPLSADRQCILNSNDLCGDISLTLWQNACSHIVIIMTSISSMRIGSLLTHTQILPEGAITATYLCFRRLKCTTGCRLDVVTKTNVVCSFASSVGESWMEIQNSSGKTVYPLIKNRLWQNSVKFRFDCYSDVGVRRRIISGCVHH